MTFPWTEERIAALRKCVEDGMTASEIGALFGVTKNTIAGKAGRLKLQLLGRSGTNMKTSQKPRKAPPVPKPQRFTRFRAPPILPPTSPADPPRAIPPAPNSRPVDLMGLTNRTCRWPLWTDDEPRLFCGALEADNADGRPYCPEHLAAALGRTYTRPDRIAAGPMGRRNVLPSRIALDKASE